MRKGTSNNFLRSDHFEKSKTKANNNISGRIAQNYRKIKSKNYKKNGTECLDFGHTFNKKREIELNKTDISPSGTAKFSAKIMTKYDNIDIQNAHYGKNTGYFIKKVHPIS